MRENRLRTIWNSGGAVNGWLAIPNSFAAETMAHQVRHAHRGHAARRGGLPGHTSVSVIIDAETYERPFYAGNAIQTVRSSDATKVLTIRTASFSAAADGAAALVQDVAAAVDPALSQWQADNIASSDHPS